jgi:dipeptidyl aminopeptidase/acylaminoacyl peptidase
VNVAPADRERCLVPYTVDVPAPTSMTIAWDSGGLRLPQKAISKAALLGLSMHFPGGGLFGFFLLALASCALPARTPDSAPVALALPTSVARPVTPFELSLASVPLVEGVSEVDVEVAAAPGEPRALDSRRHVALVLPPGIAAARPRPLIVFLHGRDGSRSTPSTLRCLVRPALGRIAPIILGPFSQHGEWWSPEDAGFVLGLVKAALRDWHVPPERVVIMGYSNGGIATWVFARLYPAVFSAAIPMASSAAVIGDTPLPVYAIHGSKDEQFDIEPVRAAIQLLAQRGFDVQLVVRNRAGHMQACSYEPELEGAAAWLETHAWQRPAN